MTRPNLEINSKTYFAYSPTYFMKDTKYQNETPIQSYKSPRVYYDNYLVNIQEIFNKHHDKQKGMIVTGKSSKSNSGSRYDFLKTKPKQETTSFIHSKLGMIK